MNKKLEPRSKEWMLDGWRKKEERVKSIFNRFYYSGIDLKKCCCSYTICALHFITIECLLESFSSFSNEPQ